MRLRRLMLVAAAGLALAVAGCGSTAAPERAAAPRAPDRFDAARAWKDLVHQVDLGPRPAGSPTLRRLAREIRARIPHGHFERIPGHPGLRNVVGSIPGT